MARILRLPDVINKIGKTRSPIYADIATGLFPRPVKLGPRAAGWPESEIEEVISARIAGANEASIRKLVAKLHEARRLAQAA